jgi:hypothetical protein
VFIENTTRRPPLVAPGRCATMAKKIFPLIPAHPERTCWGCDKYCPANSMACGNGSERTQHPVELFGEEWMHEGLDPYVPVTAELG